MHLWYDKHEWKTCKDIIQSQRWSLESSMFVFERFSMVPQRWPHLWKKLYLSPERRGVSMSLKSLGLSKDPKDPQRRPSCFPDVRKRLEINRGRYRRTHALPFTGFLDCLQCARRRSSNFGHGFCSKIFKIQNVRGSDVEFTFSKRLDTVPALLIDVKLC